MGKALQIDLVHLKVWFLFFVMNKNAKAIQSFRGLNFVCFDMNTETTVWSAVPDKKQSEVGEGI